MGWGRETKLSLLAISFVVTLAIGTQAHPDSILEFKPHHLESEDDLLDLFHSWLERHSRVYHSLSEKQHRFQIFKDNLRYIHAHNQQQKPYWLGLNKFSDLSHDEFRSQYLGTRLNANRVRKDSSFIHADVEAAKNVDWRASGAVAEVKDQGSCGEELFMTGSMCFWYIMYFLSACFCRPECFPCGKMCDVHACVCCTLPAMYPNQRLSLPSH